MFDPNKFLDPPVYQTTPAARMQLTLLDLDGIIGAQSALQIEHVANVRLRVPMLTRCIGGFIATFGNYSLYVVDGIVPDDYVRRTFICIYTEIEDIRIKMFRASGLIPSNKEE